MKKILILFLALLFGSGIVIPMDASAKTTKKKPKKTTAVRNSASTTTTQESQPITLMYKGFGYSYSTLELYPSGTVKKTYYGLDNATPTNYGMRGKYRVYGTYNGTWMKTYRLIGNNNRQYYYEINVGGQSLFYVPGYNYLYIGFSAFKDGNTREKYKIITSKPAREW